MLSMYEKRYIPYTGFCTRVSFLLKQPSAAPPGRSCGANEQNQRQLFDPSNTPPPSSAKRGAPPARPGHAKRATRTRGVGREVCGVSRAGYARLMGVRTSRVYRVYGVRMSHVYKVYIIYNDTPHPPRGGRVALPRVRAPPGARSPGAQARAAPEPRAARADLEPRPVPSRGGRATHGPRAVAADTAGSHRIDRVAAAGERGRRDAASWQPTGPGNA